ncbi:MAG TPA: methyltransferase regulatory domain-containing protein, partial [Sphingomonadales bacterium]|nr:methyltransferase regulatory domain-containing protein [Sphingomonadales bacterium]
YSAFLKAEVDYLGTKRDDYIFHEYLEKDNFPVYFHQFAEGARKAGLRYVADAEVATMLTEAFSENVAKTLRTAPNILQQEQYMDFLRNRRFRRSLLCHNGQPLDRNLKGERLKNLFVSAGAFPKGGGEAKPEADGKLTLTAGTGREVKIVYTPVLQAVLPLLWEAWPRALPFSKLMEAAKKALPKAAQGPGAIETQFGAALFRLYFGKVVGLTAFSPPAVSKAGAKPKATDLVRHQAKTMGAVTNLWHNQIRLGQVEAKLVEMLDGKTEKPAIVKALQKIVKATREAAIAKGQRVPPEPPSQDRLEQEVEKSLERLAHAALLIA